jgi:hypothetical protein
MPLRQIYIIFSRTNPIYGVFPILSLFFSFIDTSTCKKRKLKCNVKGDALGCEFLFTVFIFVDDFRIFCGDLGNEVTEEVLARAFSRYPSFLKSKVVRDKRTNKTKGYGFVSFKDPNDFVQAMREMNGKCV